jgi:hypothetical protein
MKTFREFLKEREAVDEGVYTPDSPRIKKPTPIYRPQIVARSTIRPPRLHYDPLHPAGRPPVRPIKTVLPPWLKALHKPKIPCPPARPSRPLC